MTESGIVAESDSWFAVRCIIKDDNAGTYEERITIWRAASFDEAVILAEREIDEYTSSLDGVFYVGLAQAFRMEGVPDQGSEVFSLIRESDLEPNEYLSSYFSTGSEKQGTIS
ncbi:hypothetical protein [Spirillospora sp. NPDC047279]|uniref:hypothetical protein n=1 Tax=Spirillospora sp. NPDC047279 TaxID=3155478 RepID=UPI0033F85752